MSEFAADIPVKVEINEDEKSVVILIPWHRLGRVNAEQCRGWFSKAEQVRKEWEAKGYRCN